MTLILVLGNLGLQAVIDRCEDAADRAEDAIPNGFNLSTITGDISNLDTRVDALEQANLNEDAG